MGTKGDEGPVLLLEFTVQQRQQYTHTHAQPKYTMACWQGHEASTVSGRGRRQAVVKAGCLGLRAGQKFDRPTEPGKGHSRGEFQRVQIKDHAGKGGLNLEASPCRGAVRGDRLTC